MSLARVPLQRGRFSVDPPRLYVDFNRMGRHGQDVVDGVTLVGFVPSVGDPVWLYDYDGDTCLGWVKAIRGRVYDVKVDLSTWRDGVVSSPAQQTEEESGE